MDASPAISLAAILFLVVAVAGVWALFTRRRRLGVVVTAAGLALLAYAVWWTFTPG